MKVYKYLIMLLLTGGMLVSCSKDDMDDNIDDNSELPGEEPKGDLSLEIKDFEYKAMDIWYYYNDDMEIYNDDYFSTQSELNTWLEDWDSPEDLFYDGLLLNYPITDRFSWIVDDYEELEDYFAGTTKSTGMDYGLSRYCTGCNEVFVYARYVLPETPAEEAGIERGMIFTEIDGQQITASNYSQLLAGESLELGIGKIVNGEILTTDETINVTKTVVTEDPVYIAKTFDLDGTKVGYLMYNSFTYDFDDELNDAFGYFKTEGVNELILDLRYNGGGRISSALDLSSMITGQLNNKPFIKVKYNDYIQSVYESQNPSSLTINLDDQIYEGTENSQPINSLNLNKVYVIATGSSASASELVMNGLAAYIEVVHIGTTTVGKIQGSDTYYDSNPPNFNKDSSLNPDHKYALQPLILSLVNANGEAYPEGLTPDIEQREYVDTYGVLGDPDEPLLALALEDISGNRMMNKSILKGNVPVDLISERKAQFPDYQRMYIDTDLPELNLNIE